MKFQRNALMVTSISIAFVLLTAAPSNAFTTAETGGSDSGAGSNQSQSIAQTIGNVIERVAATASQIVSPQSSDSAVAQKAYSAVPAIVCRVSIAYVLSYTPVINWTYQNSRLVPITTSLIVSTPVETRICS